MTLIIKYTIFASTAVLINLFFQHLAFSYYHGIGQIYLALLTGTFCGLVTKFNLDKKFIFYYRTKKRTEDLRKFIMYSSLSLFTTIIFWSFELSFNFLWKSEFAKYVGGLIGLIIGYTIKYFLDKKYVFIIQKD